MTQLRRYSGDEIEVRIEGADWPQRIGGSRPAAFVRKTVAAVLANCGPDGAVEVSVLLTDADSLRGLNKDYRGRDRTTNVLAFALHQDGSGLRSGGVAAVPLGDVVIAGSVCRDEAATQGKRFADHVCHLVVHGTLHLLGYNHDVAVEAETMEQLERDILLVLGISDPYEAPAAA